VSRSGENGMKNQMDATWLAWELLRLHTLVFYSPLRHERVDGIQGAGVEEEPQFYV
jgi:hypothetical protein